jgi:hypothetical protein
MKTKSKIVRKIRKSTIRSKAYFCVYIFIIKNSESFRIRNYPYSELGKRCRTLNPGMVEHHIVLKKDFTYDEP